MCRVRLRAVISNTGECAAEGEREASILADNGRACPHRLRIRQRCPMTRQTPWVHASRTSTQQNSRSACEAHDRMH